MSEIDSLGNELGIFTTTFYKQDPVSKVRQELALRLFRNANRLGIRVWNVDGGSNEEFLAAVRALDNVELLPDPHQGMGEGRRVALRAAEESKLPYFLWVEPEKDDLIKEASLNAVLEPLRQGRADIIVPKREHMASLPKLQRQLESRANLRASQLLASESAVDEVWDLWFGPKMMNREGAKFFRDYQGKLDKWDAIIRPVHEAFRAGKKVRSVLVDYTYDPSQSSSEEDDRTMKGKRVEQYVTILAEMGDPFCQRKVAEYKERAGKEQRR